MKLFKLFGIVFLLFFITNISVSFAAITQDFPVALTLSDSGTSGQTGGMISLNQNITLNTAVVTSGVTATNAYLYQDIDADNIADVGELISNVTIVGGVATFDELLTPDYEYILYVDSLGSTFTRYYQTGLSFPYTDTYVNWEHGKEGSNTVEYIWDYITVSEPILTPLINTNVSGNYNLLPIIGSANTTNNVNMTFYVNGVQIGQVNDTNSTTYTISSLLQGENNISLKSEDFQGTNWNNFTIQYQPYMFVYFEDENATAVTNFSVNGTLYENYANIFLPDYGYGTHTFLFEKLGFNSSTFQLTFNETNFINTTFSVPGSRIEISVYDLTDYTLIDNSTTTIEIIGNSFSAIYTTMTGVLNISSLVMEDETYSIVVSNLEYETTATSFNYNNQEVIEVVSYMTPLEVNGTLIADIIIKVVDDYLSPISGINVLQYVWDSGQSKYVQSNLKATDYNGETSFKVFLNTKRYNFCAEYLGVQYCETDLFININTQVVTIEVPISELLIFDEDSIYDIDFSYTLTSDDEIILGENYTSVTFSYNNPNQDVDEYCLNIYEIVNLNRVLVPGASFCSNDHSNGFSVDVIKNTSKNYVAIASIQVDDNLRELDTLYLYATYDLQEELDKYGFVKIFILALITFIIGIAIHKKIHNISIAHFGLPIVFLVLSFMFPEYISFESFVLVALVNLMAWKLITKKDDISKEAKFGTLTSIIALYMIFIFSLTAVLTEMDNKGYLDDYGTTLLYGDDTKGITGLIDDNSYFDSYITETNENLKDKRVDANEGEWDLITGIFLKTIEFLDMFFSVLSNLFRIATNLATIIGFTNGLILKFVKIIDFVAVGTVIYLYFREAFK